MRCACTGVRWCADCAEPDVRRERGMHPPLPLPKFLTAPVSGPNVFDFDPETRSTVGLPEFSGVVVFEDFVSPAEEHGLLQTIETETFAPAQSGKSKQHFGPKVSFKQRKVRTDTFAGLPPYASDLEARARARLRDADAEHVLAEYETTDVFVLRYEAAHRSNLDFHLDDVFAYGEAIMDLSLESDAFVTFLPTTDIQDLANAKCCVRVPVRARSLLVLYGEARYRWSHGILADDIVGRRTSITLRTLSTELRDTDVGRAILAIARTQGLEGAM